LLDVLTTALCAARATRGLYDPSLPRGARAARLPLRSTRWPRFATTELHRFVTLLTLVLIAVHVLVAMLDRFMSAPALRDLRQSDRRAGCRGSSARRSSSDGDFQLRLQGRRPAGTIQAAGARPLTLEIDLFGFSGDATSGTVRALPTGASTERPVTSSLAS
jgi:hypothetical protein